jgi:hypothetical protein
VPLTSGNPYRGARSSETRARTSQLDLEYLLTRLNQVMHSWANYFRHAVAKGTFGMLDHFAWWRVIRMLRTRRRWRWGDVRRFTDHTGRWLPITAGRDQAAANIGNTGHPVPIPRQPDPRPLGG